MVHRKKLTIRPAQDLHRAIELLELAAAKDVSGQGSAQDLAQGAAVFELLDPEGVRVGAFAVRVDTYSDGRLVTVTAAGGKGDNGATEAMAAWVEDQARYHIKARAVTCTTQRRGLVRRLQGLGYRVAGYVMQKDI